MWCSLKFSVTTLYKLYSHLICKKPHKRQIYWIFLLFQLFVVVFFFFCSHQAVKPFSIFQYYFANPAAASKAQKQVHKSLFPDCVSVTGWGATVCMCKRAVIQYHKNCEITKTPQIFPLLLCSPRSIDVFMFFCADIYCAENNYGLYR